MKRYTLAVTGPEYWSEIHDSLIVDSNKDGIPDRQVTCSDNKEHSPTRGTYELTDAEAAEIANHPHVKWIELSPTDNPDNYPKPQPATKRFRKKRNRILTDETIPYSERKRRILELEADRDRRLMVIPLLQERANHFKWIGD